MYKSNKYKKLITSSNGSDALFDSAAIDKKNKMLEQLSFARGYATYTIKYLTKQDPSPEKMSVNSAQFNTIYAQEATPGIMSFSIEKAYANKPESVDATAKDLGLSRLPENQEECEQFLGNILAFTSEKGITNTGFHGLPLGKVFELNTWTWKIMGRDFKLPGSELVLWRATYVMLFLALLTEFSFGGTQFYFGADSLEDPLGFIRNALATMIISYPITGIISLFDLIVNLLLIPVRNSVNDLVIGGTGSESKQRFKNIATVLSIPADVFGCTGSVYGFLPLLLPEKKCSAPDSCSEARNLARALSGFVLVVGCFYYEAMLRPNSDWMFDFYTSKLVFTWPNSNNTPRWNQIFIEFLSNDAFRTTLLAGTTIAVAPFLGIELSSEVAQQISIAVCAAVTADLMLRRNKGTIKRWSHEDFIHIHTNELNDAQKSLSTYEMYSFAKTAMGIIMAIGTGFAASCYFDISKDPIIGSIATFMISAYILMVNLTAQRSRAIADKALKDMPPEELIKRRNAKLLSVDERTVLLDDKSSDPIACVKDLSAQTESQRRDQRVKAIKTYYAALGGSLRDLVPQNWFQLFVIGSLTIRGLVEITATDVLETTWGLNLPPLGLYGVVLFLFLPTLENLSQIFLPGLIDACEQRIGEKYVQYCKETKCISADKRPEFSAWDKASPCRFILRSIFDYLASGYDAPLVQDVDYAVTRRREELR